MDNKSRNNKSFNKRQIYNQVNNKKLRKKNNLIHLIKQQIKNKNYTQS